MEWQTPETAPKDGRRFIAWDRHKQKLLFTVFWDVDEFITEYESWSGVFSHWTPRPKPPGEQP